ncbi:hypothetical protein PV326_011294 [Microctonus aethiopoides]|nr:hypothetical protein PV326_011294 [Microctonus aethiopoides]
MWRATPPGQITSARGSTGSSLPSLEGAVRQGMQDIISESERVWRQLTEAGMAMDSYRRRQKQERAGNQGLANKFRAWQMHDNAVP